MLKNRKGLMFVSHPWVRVQIFLQPVTCPGPLESGPSWPGQSWTPEQEAGRGWGRGGQEYIWNDEDDYFSCGPDWEAWRVEPGACAHRHQPGTRCHGEQVMGAGALDASVPLGWGNEGCCISQLGRNQFNGPFKMCIKNLRIPHFNIKYS